MMDVSDALFLAACGGIIGWIGFWAFIMKLVKTRYPNAPPGSRGKKIIDAISIMQLLPLLPVVPIIVIWILGVRRPIEMLKRRRAGKKEVVKMRRRWEAVRRDWARSDIESARSEKPPLFDTDESLDDGIRPEIPSTQPNQPAISGKSHFESLPAELRIQIYSYLDLGMAIRLSLVSRFFREDQPYESIDREQRAIYLYHADTFRQNQKAGRLACYTCLKLRDKGEFSEDLRTGCYRRFGAKEMERRCFDCQVVKGEISWSRVLGRTMGRWETQVWNRLVGLVRRKPRPQQQAQEPMK